MKTTRQRISQKKKKGLLSGIGKRELTTRTIIKNKNREMRTRSADHGRVIAEANGAAAELQIPRNETMKIADFRRVLKQNLGHVCD